MYRRLICYTGLLFFLGLVLSQLTGCGSMSGQSQNAPGQAAYRMERVNPDGTKCTVEIASGRDVEKGEVTIGGENCDVTANADSLSGAQIQMQMLNLIRVLSDKVPGR